MSIQAKLSLINYQSKNSLKAVNNELLNTDIQFISIMNEEGGVYYAS